MTYRLLVRRQAKSDLRRAARWYELQRPGLGRDFVAQVEAALERVTANPQQYQVLHRDIRRAIPRKFPFGVFYRIDGNNIIVFAIIHLHQDPAAWRERG